MKIGNVKPQKIVFVFPVRHSVIEVLPACKDGELDERERERKLHVLALRAKLTVLTQNKQCLKVSRLKAFTKVGAIGIEL